MENNFCTLFDSGYLSRGFALVESLLATCENFQLFILAMDDLSYEVITEKNYKNVIAIKCRDFEDEELKKIKPTRSRGEYCWTCTPSILKYCIEKYNLEQCTYLDADLYFFSSPEALLKEMNQASASVLITEHRYTPKYDQTATSGKYCVQFMSFKNDVEGKKVLNWWRERCLEWCFARVEDGKFGDQKYLDKWKESFEKVHELQHLGGGVAPWNMQQYSFCSKNEDVYLIANGSTSEVPVVFFHFHGMKIFNDRYDLGPYDMDANIISHIYAPYLKCLENIEQKLAEKGYSFNWHAQSPWDTTLRGHASRLKRRIMKNHNIYSKEYFLNGHSN